jgi:hypothetical protein
MGLACPGRVSKHSLRTTHLRCQCVTPDFDRLRWDIHQPPVPVAPARSLGCWGSAANGTTGIVGDDVAALSQTNLEQFRPLSGVWLLHEGHLCTFGWISGSRVSRPEWPAPRPAARGSQ